MINVEVTQEDLKRPEVYQALMKLIESLNVPLSIETEVPKKTSSKRNTLPKVKVEIDDEISRAYGAIVTKPKSQFFLTIVKQKGYVSSDEVQEIFQKHFTNFAMKGIGGITGALKRWSSAEGVALPYRHVKDQHGTQYFEWVGIPQELDGGLTMSKQDHQALIKAVTTHNPKYRSYLERLIKQGVIEQAELKGNYQDFLNVLTQFNSAYFSPLGDQIKFIAKIS
jgi:hypothetical protein